MNMLLAFTVTAVIIAIIFIEKLRRREGQKRREDGKRVEHEDGKSEPSSSSSTRVAFSPSSEDIPSEDDEVKEPYSPTAPSPVDISGTEFDVFLSFRGPDTRNGFTSHLYQTLKDKGVRAFIDSRGLHRGERVEELLSYIRKSKVIVVVFSKGYADSKWCLKEITEAMDCNKLIIPVFYKVEPSHFGDHTGPFARSFQQHQRNPTLDEGQNWGEALKRAGNISGFVFKFGHGNEAELIQDIVSRILDLINKVPLDVALHPVGLDSRVTNILALLDMNAIEVQMVGIHGMGGIGKTTLAKAVFNKIYLDFEGSVFIDNVKGKAKQHDGLASLQKQIIRLTDRETDVRSESEGKALIQERLRFRKVLIILDDVDEKKQLEFLVGSKQWFRKSSRIIITTRNKDILTKHDLNEDKIYEVAELDHHQSCQLFCYHAFKGEKPQEGYSDLTNDIVKHAGKLPLALETLGNYLYKTCKEVWEETLEELKTCPPRDVFSRLEISYAGLTENEQRVFLDIACFFNRMELQYAKYIWEACGLRTKTALSTLMNKALVKTNKRGQLEMHDLHQDMGKQIVVRENRDKPWKHKRLWNYDDISVVMKRLMERKKSYMNVEGISVDFGQEKVGQEAACLNAKTLALLPSLRLLRINDANFHDYLNGSLPVLLRWLEWKGCPLQHIPDCLDLNKTAVLDLSNSKIVTLCNKQLSPRTDGSNRAYLTPRKGFEGLKVLILKGCKSLQESPNFESAPNLVKLILDDCYELVKIDVSIWSLKSLEFWSMKNCEKLKELPHGKFFTWAGIESTRDSIGNLPKLEKLLLRNCSSLAAIPDSIGCLAKLQKLDVRNCQSLDPLPNPVGFKENFTSLCLLHDFITQDYQAVFDVLINSSLEETAKVLASALSSALKDQGVLTYSDSQLSEEENIEELSDAIDRSKIFIPIFSRGYARSSRCLVELTRMVECRRMIIPIFLDVNQLDIMFLKGAFEEAFQNHEENKELDGKIVDQWRMALREAGGLEGYNFKSQPNWDEEIQPVAERVLSIVNKNEFDESNGNFRLPRHVKRLLKILDLDQTGDVRVIVILDKQGRDGVAVAKAVFRKVHQHFEGGSSFIPSDHEGGLISLQKQILGDISNEENIDICSAEEGWRAIKKVVSKRRVLIVLDGIFAGDIKDWVSTDWFGPGSRIIILTCNVALLRCWGLKIYRTYDLDELPGHVDYLQLFSRCAFMSDQPKLDYAHLSSQIVSTTNMQPEVIEVIGSYLSHVSNVEEWKDILDKLKENPHNIIENLRVIYDRLDRNEQEIVLDVACFFAGEDTDNAVCMWRDCEYLPDNDIVTAQREKHALLHSPFFKINGQINQFEMHDEVRDFGKYINQQHRKPVRLWDAGQIWDLLHKHGGRSDIQGIVLNSDSLKEYLELQSHEIVSLEDIHLRTETFESMSKLQLLRINNMTLEGEFRYMPKEIKWLEWKRCCLDWLPSDFSIEKLVILDLSHSTKLKQVWNGNKVFHKLESLYLSGCINLVVCPNFASIPCLRKLVLDHCERLRAVDESIGELKSLVHLNMNHCISLTLLPEEICHLCSLQTLKLRGCCGISRLPLRMWEMKSLEDLDISFTAIESVSYSLGCLPKLKKVNVTGCTSILTSLSSLD